MALDWVSFGSAISGAVIGGLVTGYFTHKATKDSFTNQLEQGDKNEERLIMGLLQAIHDEIESIFERYQDTMGVRLESLKDGEPVALYYPLVSDFFAVYNGNTFLIGRIRDHDLRKQIIKTYTLAKGIVDSFRLNNDFVAKLDMANKIFEETGSDVHKNQLHAHYLALVDYAKTLKEAHLKLKQEVGTLLRDLRKAGVLSK